MHQVMVNSIQFNLNWIWIGLLILAGVFLIVAIGLLLGSMASTMKRVKQFGRDGESSIKQINDGMKSIQTHTENVVSNIDYVKSQIASETEAVTEDIRHIQETAEVMIDTTTTAIEEVSTVTAVAMGLASTSAAAVKGIVDLLPNKPERKKKELKVQKVAREETRKGRSAMNQAKKNVTVTLPRTIQKKVWLLVKPAADTVETGRKRVRKHKRAIGKRVRSGKHRILTIRKQGKKLLRKGQRRYRNLRRKVA